MNDLSKLAYSSRGSQDHFELRVLLDLLSKKLPKTILEIGVDKGYLCHTWRQAFPEAVIVGVDISDSQLDGGGYEFVLGDSKSQEVYNHISKYLGFEIDLLFIDGDHGYEAVKADYEAYGRLVPPRGIIVFHDIMRMPGEYEGVEVRKFWNEIRSLNNTMEIWGGHGSPGTGVIFK